MIRRRLSSSASEQSVNDLLRTLEMLDAMKPSGASSSS